MSRPAFWRVTYREEGAPRRSAVYLDWDARVAGDLLVGVEVDRHGTRVAPRTPDGREHDGPGHVTRVIDLGLDVRRQPMTLDRDLGEYVAGEPEPLRLFIAVDKWQREHPVPTRMTLRDAQTWAAEHLGPNGYSTVIVRTAPEV